jgi:gamma-glutamyl:cysteine ligase YbdK (ATP-grasp superfamily)
LRTAQPHLLSDSGDASWLNGRDYGFARARSMSAMVIIIVIGSIGDS